MSKKDRIRELKAKLKDFKAECKKCDCWECGHCAEPKWLMEQELERLEGRTA